MLPCSREKVARVYEVSYKPMNDKAVMGQRGQLSPLEHGRISEEKNKWP